VEVQGGGARGGFGGGRGNLPYAVIAREEDEDLELAILNSLSSAGCTSEGLQTVEAAKQSTEWYDSETRKIATNCEKMLNSITWQTISPYTYEGLLKRFDMMKEEGLPDMLVLPATTLLSLGRIPRSHERDAETQEPYTIKARAAVEQFGGYGACHRETVSFAKIFFFSHRWKRGEWCEALGRDLTWDSEERKEADKFGLRVGDPDGAQHEKAVALIEWSVWYATCIAGSSSIDNIFFWIDWPCVDQENKGPSMAALPAYVAASHNIVAAWTHDYDGRAWCQVERMMACSYMAEGDRIYAFGEGFANCEDVVIEETIHLAPSPSSGITTNPNDKTVIESLQRVASRAGVFSLAALCIPFLELRRGTWLFIIAFSACSAFIQRPGWTMAEKLVNALFIFFVFTFAIAFFFRQRGISEGFSWLVMREARPGLGKVNRIFVRGLHEDGLIPRIEAVEPDGVWQTRTQTIARMLLLLGIAWCLVALNIFVSSKF